MTTMHRSPTDEEIGRELTGLDSIIWAQTVRDKEQMFRGGMDSLRDAIGDTIDRRIKQHRDGVA